MRSNLMTPLFRSTLLTIMLFAGGLRAQTSFTISGYVEDAASGERLIGASVFDLRSKKGTATNAYGFFSLTLPADSVQLRFSFVGYQSQVKAFMLSRDEKFVIQLGNDVQLEEVTVIGDRPAENTQMSTISLQMDKVKSLPVLLGERDVLKTIQLLPGIKSGTEGSSGIYVRGGGPDQNLILLDGVPVYNASHLFGFFSVFNSEAISSVDIVKGGFPARYGGRLSSVLDIRMKEGNMKEFHGEGSVGIIASRLTLEGPIKKDKTSFMVSARRTYLDLLARPLIKAQNNGEAGGYYFYDLNGKINHKINDKNRLYFSTYYGKDRFYTAFSDEYVSNGDRYKNRTEFGLDWGNLISALRWNWEINKKLFANTTVTYSRYQFNIGFSDETKRLGSNPMTSINSFNYYSGINDWAGKIDFYYVPSAKHTVRFGAGEIYHTFTPGVNSVRNSDGSNNVDTTFGSQKKFAHEFFAYAEDDWEINPRLKINAGLHLSGFVVGDKNYWNFQPRVSGRYMLDEVSSLKLSYSRMAQYIHLLTNAGIGLPTDLWVPATENVKPQVADQVAMGYSRSMKKDLQLTVEAYYKYMQGLIEYKDGASFFGSDRDWQDKVEVGEGRAYGAEVLLERKTGKTTGWIGYTLSWSDRQFANLNFGDRFPYRYDSRHNISVAVTHHITDKIDIGVVWVYATGNAVTLGYERYNALKFDPAGNFYSEVVHINKRNNYRMPDYHRLDVGLNFHKKHAKWERTFSLSVYNMYSRQNAFFLFFDYNNNGEQVLKQVSLFPIIPSISYSFKF
mgnify:CR=1 FL=1